MDDFQFLLWAVIIVFITALVIMISNYGNSKGEPEKPDTEKTPEEITLVSLELQRSSTKSVRTIALYVKIAFWLAIIGVVVRLLS